MKTIKEECFSEFNMTPQDEIMSLARETQTELYGFTKNATGVVKDEFGNPVPNANVYLQSNNRIGTATNQEGYFEIENVANGSVIIVSHVTFKTQSYIFQGANKEIVMIPNVEVLDEVVLDAPKKSYAWAYLLGAVAIGTFLFKGNSKSKGLGATKKRSKNVVKVTI